ncbi:MAG: hypothetical protein CML20_05375 [Rheinheimera sp.]|nr:hypothetical protein [Rheinheimera sp.]
MRTLLLCFFLLAGCASKPPQLIVSPQVFWPQAPSLNQTSFDFYLLDQRSNMNTLVIYRGEYSKGYATANDLRAELEQTVATALKARGASLSNQSGRTLTIQINQLQARVNQRPLDHVVVNRVTMTVLVQHNGNTFSKAYSGDSRQIAPLKADIAVIERELRVLTEQVLTDLLRDESWQTEIRG